MLFLICEWACHQEGKVSWRKRCYWAKYCVTQSKMKRTKATLMLKNCRISSILLRFSKRHKIPYFQDWGTIWSTYEHLQILCVWHVSTLQAEKCMLVCIFNSSVKIVRLVRVRGTWPSLLYLVFGTSRKEC